jgi:hypothetical protein
MKYIKQFCTFLAFAAISLAQEKPDQSLNNGTPIFAAKATFKIIDEDATPIEGTSVHVAVWNHSHYKDQNNDFHGQSNNEGLFIVESNCQGNFEITVQKEGYYRSNYHHQPCDWSTMPKDGDRLQPWNPTVPIMLKKIGKPIPMIVRPAKWNNISELPIMNEHLGFDLVVLDWLPPYGKGKRADIRVKAVRNEGDEKNYTANLTIEFPNKGDGVIAVPKILGGENELKYPRSAPLIGYSGEPLLRNLRHQEKIDESLQKTIEPFGYILRIRTEFDASGKVISALFGKIVDDSLTTDEALSPQWTKNPIHFACASRPIEKNGVKSTGCYFSFSYYLNPTHNDRNLEFDMKNNLAPEAKWKDYPVP